MNEREGLVPELHILYLPNSKELTFYSLAGQTVSGIHRAWLSADKRDYNLICAGKDCLCDLIVGEKKSGTQKKALFQCEKGREIVAMRDFLGSNLTAREQIHSKDMVAQPEQAKVENEIIDI